MIKKYVIHLFVLSIVLFVGCNRQKNHNEEIKTITVDTSTSESKLDISELLDLDQVEIISLETRDDCLISSKGTIQIIDSNIIIGDNTTKRLLLFDRNGSFVRNIGRHGRGPGEYAELGGFTAVKDSVYVQDAAQNKVVIYSLKENGFREIRLDPPIYYVDLFSSNDRLYFVTNYASTGKISANLVTMDMKNGERKYYIPFDRNIEDSDQAWGLNRYSASNGDETLVVYAHNDTIYRVNGYDVSAQYVMDFTRNKIPASLLSQSGVNILGESLKNGYNTGLDEIYNFSDYFFAEFSEGSTNRYKLIYDKSGDEVLLGESLIISGMGGLQVLDFSASDHNELILAYDVHVLKNLWEYVLSKNEFAETALKESVKNAVLASQDDNNPIVMIIKLKSSDVQ